VHTYDGVPTVGARAEAGSATEPFAQMIPAGRFPWLREQSGLDVGYRHHG